MTHKIRFEIVFLSVLVFAFVFGSQYIFLGRGANFTTATDLTLDPATAFPGDTVSMLAHVWSPQIGQIPSGDVLFEDVTNGVFQQVVPLNSTGYASYNWVVPTAYPPSTISIHAHYSGDDWFYPSEDFESLTIDDGLYSTTTTLTLSVTSVFPGETVTLFAAVQNTESSDIPTGDVVFEDAIYGVLQETVALDSSGQASYVWTVPTTYPAPSLPTTITLRAVYLGVPNIFTSSEDTEDLYIEAPFTSVVDLTLIPSISIAIGDAINLAADVWGPATTWIPTGTITFSMVEEYIIISTETLDSVGAASTSWDIPASLASYMGSTITFRAEYSGDTFFATSSTDKSISVDVTSYTTTTVFSISPTSATPGSLITLTAQVTTQPATSLIPLGSLSFEDVTNSQTLDTVSLDANGRVEIQWTIPSTQTPQDLTLSAYYHGDGANLFLSSADTKILVVEPFGSTISVITNVSEVWVNNPVEIQVIVSGVGTGRVPTGAVTLRDDTNGIVIDTLLLNSSGMALKTWTVPLYYNEGAIELVADYGGDIWFYMSSSSAYLTIHGDTTPPLVTLNVTDYQVVSGIVIIEVVANDATTVTISVNGTALAGNPAYYTFITTGYPDGSIVLSFYAEDILGNNVTLDRALIIDNSNPTISLTGVNDGDIVNGTLTIDVTVTDATTVTISVNGEVVSGNPVSYTLQTTDYADGTFVLTVSATDAGGNTATIQRTFTIDNNPPRISLNVAENDVVSGFVTIDISTSDVTPVSIFVNETQLSGTTYQFQSTDYPDGPCTLTIRGVDAVGHGTVLKRTIVIDNNPPTITYISVSNNEVVSGVEQIEITVNDTTAVTVTANGDPVTGSPLIYILDATASPDGDFAFQVRVVDEPGNEAVVSLTLVIDNNAPSFTEIGINDGDQVRGMVNIPITVNDATPVTIYVNGEAFLQNPTIYTFDTTLQPDGPFVLIFRAVDTAGHETSETRTVIIGNTVPIITTNVQNQEVVEGTIVIQVEVQAETAVSIDINNQPQVGNPTSYAFDTTVEADGPFSLVITAEDQAKNVATEIITLIIDNTPPKITSVGVKDGSLVSSEVKLRLDADDETDVTFWVNEEKVRGDIFKLDTTKLPEGENEIEVRAKDEAGHTSETSITVYVDNSPPNITLDYDEATKSMIVSVEDPHLDYTCVYVNHSVFESVTHVEDDPGDRNSFDLDFTDLPLGTYQVQVDSVDVTGNLGFQSVLIVLEPLEEEKPLVTEEQPLVTEEQPPVTSKQFPEVPTSEEDTLQQRPTDVVKNSIPTPVIGLGVVGIVSFAVLQIASHRGISLRRFF